MINEGYANRALDVSNFYIVPWRIALSCTKDVISNTLCKRGPNRNSRAFRGYAKLVDEEFVLWRYKHPEKASPKPSKICLTV